MTLRLGARVVAAAVAAAAVAAHSAPASAATAWTVPLAAASAAKARAVALPAAPGKPDAQCSSFIGSTIDVSWGAVSGARGYTIYRNGKLLKSVPSTTLSIADSLVSALGSYTYTVSADIVSGRWNGPQSPKSASHSIVFFFGCI